MELIYSISTKIMGAADPRVEHKFLMDSPLPTIIIVACYIYFVKVLILRLEFESDKILHQISTDLWTKMDGRKEAFQINGIDNVLQFVSSFVEHLVVLWGESIDNYL